MASPPPDGSGKPPAGDSGEQASKRPTKGPGRSLLRSGSAPKAPPVPREALGDVARKRPEPPTTLPLGPRQEEAIDELSLDVDVEIVKNPSTDPPENSPSSRPPVELPAICMFGRFEIVGRLAFGGMAEIFLARERSEATGASRYLVIKRVLAHVADDEDFVRMFLDEARLAIQLNHPGICHIYEFGELDGSYFIAMEWVNGVPLGKLVRRARAVGGLPSEVGAKIIAMVAAALHYAHRARDAAGRPLGIVHRDVSPHNIMVSYDGNVKLLDFGIAKASTHATKTQAGVIKGKFSYMSPQQCLGQPIDARADVFALGVCLYETLTGKPLYHRKTEYETMKAVVEEPVPSIRNVEPKLPEALDQICRKALMKNPDDRFRSAAPLGEALEQWLVENGTYVSASKVAEVMEDLYSEEIGRGPLVDSTPFGASFDRERAGMTPSGMTPSGMTPSGVGGSGPTPSGTRPVRPAERPSILDDEEAPTEVDDDFYPATTTGRSKVPLTVAGAAVLLAASGFGAWIALSGSDEGTVEADPSAGAEAEPEPEEAEPGPETGAPTEEVTPEQVEPAAATGGVRVTTRPAGATVRIDEEEADGTTPLELEDLEPGTHAIEVERAGLRTWSGEVDIVAGETAEVRRRLLPVRQEPATPPGRLSINTRPWSKVFVGGRMLGTTPIGGVTVPSGAIRLRLVDRDGRTHHRSIRVPPGEEARASYDLR